MSKEYDVELPTQNLPTPSKKSVQSLIASMVNLEDMTSPPAKICIMGDQGTGKTTAIQKFMQAITPTDKRLIYVDSAEGWTALQNFPELKRRTKWMQFENLEQLLILAAAIRDKVPPFDTVGGVVLDEYSSMIKNDKTWIVKARALQAEKEGKFRDPFTPQRPDYLASQIRSEDVISAFLRCGINVGFVSHEKFDEKTLQIRPDFPPGAANDFQRLIHSVIRAEVKFDKATKQSVRQFQLQPIGNRVSVKNRIGGLGNFIRDIDELSEAYFKWGIVKDGAQPNMQLTETEANEIAEQDELLRLLNKETKESE
jgi:GTPase SAR1 family protein